MSIYGDEIPEHEINSAADAVTWFFGQCCDLNIARSAEFKSKFLACIKFYVETKIRFKTSKGLEFQFSRKTGQALDSYTLSGAEPLAVFFTSMLGAGIIQLTSEAMRGACWHAGDDDCYVLTAYPNLVTFAGKVIWRQ